MKLLHFLLVNVFHSIFLQHWLVFPTGASGAVDGSGSDSRSGHSTSSPNTTVIAYPHHTSSVHRGDAYSHHTGSNTKANHPSDVANYAVPRQGNNVYYASYESASSNSSPAIQNNSKVLNGSVTSGSGQTNYVSNTAESQSTNSGTNKFSNHSQSSIPLTNNFNNQTSNGGINYPRQLYSSQSNIDQTLINTNNNYPIYPSVQHNNAPPQHQHHQDITTSYYTTNTSHHHQPCTSGSQVNYYNRANGSVTAHPYNPYSNGMVSTHPHGRVGVRPAVPSYPSSRPNVIDIITVGESSLV